MSTRLDRNVHDERLVHRLASDTVLPLINHALATSPNTELGGLSPAELDFFTRFNLPPPIIPGNNYCELFQQLDNNLAIVRSVTNTHQPPYVMHDSQRHLTITTNLAILSFGTLASMLTLSVLPNLRPCS